MVKVLDKKVFLVSLEDEGKVFRIVAESEMAAIEFLKEQLGNKMLLELKVMTSYVPNDEELLLAQSEMEILKLTMDKVKSLVLASIGHQLMGNIGAYLMDGVKPSSESLEGIKSATIDLGCLDREMGTVMFEGMGILEELISNPFALISADYVERLIVYEKKINHCLLSTEFN